MCSYDRFMSFNVSVFPWNSCFSNVFYFVGDSCFVICGRASTIGYMNEQSILVNE